MGDRMGVGFYVGDHAREVGAQDFLHAFFSTISHHLEPNGWGSKYPEIMKHLYQGKLAAEHARKARDDLHDIRRKLARLTPDEFVWDIEDPTASPPWAGREICSEITNLSDLFITGRGENLFDVLAECLYVLEEQGGCMTIGPY